ncbi:MAG: acyloxyacyl hydrolase [Bacteroidales bacterium]|nr:acyloxyacyl hydrolase [Bacteroidales bacterium]
MSFSVNINQKWWLVLILFIITCNAYSSAHDTIMRKTPFIIGIRQHYGFIIPHSQSIRSISHSNPWIIEADFDWLQLGENAWDYCFCYPRIGATLGYVNFNNPDIIGSGIYIVPHIEPFLSYTSKINISYRAGLGFAYLNNPYDSLDNPLNYFYSTHIGFVVLINIALNIHLNDQLNLRIAANYNHISNGGISLPNKGINFPTTNIGLDYTFNQQVIKARPKTKKDLYPKDIRFNTSFIFTGKNAERSETKMYPVIGISCDVSKVVARVSAIDIGAEWISDGALKERLRRDSINLDHNKIALMAGHELLIGKFTFSQQIGLYIYDPHKARNEVYQRYGLYYKITPHFYTGINLKSHLHVADFLDMRIGYTF